MVNGFYGLALLSKGKSKEAIEVLNAINTVNAVENFSFYENFNSETKEPNGVPFCAWSAAATVFLHQSLYTNFKFLL
jgi:glycogen debranching enzyme